MRDRPVPAIGGSRAPAACRRSGFRRAEPPCMVPAMPVPSQVDRYVFRQLAVALVAVTGALVALIWLTQSLRFVELVVNRGLSLRVFLQLTGLLVPGFVAVILPITTFVVVQFIYQRLAGDRELVVMRAAGISPLSLARPALALALAAVIAGYALSLWLVPVSYAAFREYQFEIRNRLAAFLLQEGVFTPVSEDLTVYVRRRDPDGTLRGILIEDTRQRSTEKTILAERGRLVGGSAANGSSGAKGGAPRILLLDGSQQELDRHTGRLNVLTFAQTVVNLAAGAKGEEQRYRDAAEMSLGELLHPDPQAVAARDRGKLIVEGWRRLTQPLTAASFALVGLVSVLTGGFQRHGNVLRPLGGVLAVVGLLALGLAISNFAARQVSLVPLMLVEAVLPGLVCAWVLFMPQAAWALRHGRARPARA